VYRARATATTFDVDSPAPLVQTGPQYIVSADGDRFLVNEVLSIEGTPSIAIVVNWPTLTQGR